MTSGPVRGQAARTWILKLDHDDPEREMEFELAYQRSLTTQQRFDMMFCASQRTAQMLADYENRTGRPALRDASLDCSDLGEAASASLIY